MSTNTDTTEAPVQGCREPNLIDVAAAVVAEDDTDSPTLDVLGFIAAHQEAEARWRDNLNETWLIEANTRLTLIRHGMTAALDLCPNGGTTREYEFYLSMMAALVRADRHHPAYKFYEQQVRDNNGLAPVNGEVWEGFYPKGYYADERYA